LYFSFLGHTHSPHWHADRFSRLIATNDAVCAKDLLFQVILIDSKLQIGQLQMDKPGIIYVFPHIFASTTTLVVVHDARLNKKYISNQKYQGTVYAEGQIHRIYSNGATLSQNL
jgi:hypothetical protein